MNALQPIRYDLVIRPDIINFIFNAQCKIQFKLEENKSTISLDALDLKINKVFFNNQQIKFTLNKEEEKLLIDFGKNLEPGIFEIDIHYNGEINNKMAGFYRSYYQKGNQKHAIAVTQFEESDARRAFPCFDHPRFKAVFHITMIIPSNLKAFSNEEVLQEKKLPDGLVEVRFKPTPLMSTYLVFFGLGDFHTRVDSIDSKIRAVALEDRIEYTDFCLEFGRKTLHFLEEYYDINYPLSKMEFLAIPDFAFGAMENWGAITFRENLLLYYPGVTSKAGLTRIAEVIAHEIVHQWFGNLVTPTDWKYLWLNESFATFFGFYVLDHFYPDWDIWPRFIAGHTYSAMIRDSLESTIAIEIPGGEHIVINSSTAPIIYNKGGSILRQIKEYLGEDSFKEGLRYFLKEFSFKNAESKDFWVSLQKIISIPVLDLMKSWVEQPGFPLIQVNQNDDDLILIQSRFSYHGESLGKWIIPVKLCFFLQDGRQEEKQILLSEKRQMVSIPGNTMAYKLNAGQSGFYRVQYLGQSNLDNLCDMIEEGRISSEDAFGIEVDLYELMLAGRITFQDYLKRLKVFMDQYDYLPANTLLDHFDVMDFLLPETQRMRVRDVAVKFISGLINHLGFEVKDNENQATSILRDRVIPLCFKYNIEAAMEKIRDKATQMLKGIMPQADLQKGLLQVCAMIFPDKTKLYIDENFEKLSSEHQRMNCIAALGFFQNEDDLKWAYNFALKRVPARNRYLPFVGFSQNRAALSSLWDFYLENEKALTKIHPIHFERIAERVIVSCGVHLGQEVSNYFIQFSRKSSLAKEVISLAFEKMNVYQQFLKTHFNN